MIEYKTQEMQMIPYKDRRKIEKKVLPEYYKGIRTHKKMFELRKDEDGIKPGDILVLREWDGEKYTGGMTRREVTAILKDCPEYGLMDGYCILSLQTPGWDFVTPSAQQDVPDTNVGDMISRQAVIDVVIPAMIDGADADMVEGLIHLLPSAQPEIIRCKDCEFYTEGERWCRRLGLCGAFDPNGYCSHAERRTDGD